MAASATASIDAVNETCGPVVTRANREIDVQIRGTFTGTLQLQEAVEISGTANWEPVTDDAGNILEYTDTATPTISRAGPRQIRLEATAWSSGTATCRIDVGNRRGG